MCPRFANSPPEGRPGAPQEGRKGPQTDPNINTNREQKTIRRHLETRLPKIAKNHKKTDPPKPQKVGFRLRRASFSHFQQITKQSPKLIPKHLMLVPVWPKMHQKALPKGSLKTTAKSDATSAPKQLENKPVLAREWEARSIKNM